MVNKRTNHGMRRTIIKLNTKTREVSCCWCAQLFYSTLYPVCSSNIWNLTNWHQSYNTEDYYFDLCCIVKNEWNYAIFFCGNWPECMLYCKTLMLCNPSDMFAWAYSLLILKNKIKRVQIIKRNKKEKWLLFLLDSPYQRRLLVTINYQFQIRNWKIKF